MAGGRRESLLCELSGVAVESHFAPARFFLHCCILLYCGVMGVLDTGKALDFSFDLPSNRARIVVATTRAGSRPGLIARCCPPWRSERRYMMCDYSRRKVVHERYTRVLFTSNSCLTAHPRYADSSTGDGCQVTSIALSQLYKHTISHSPKGSRVRMSSNEATLEYHNDSWLEISSLYIDCSKIYAQLQEYKPRDSQKCACIYLLFF